MTIEKDADFLRGILDGTSHAVPCVCPLCLHATYRRKINIRIKIQKGAVSEMTRGLNGRPYSPLAFFIRYWIARRGGIDEAKTIIRDVRADPAYAITDEDICTAVHRHRDERTSFERLLVALENERRWAWIRKKAAPSEEWKLDHEARGAKDLREVELFRKIVQYIRDRGKPTTMRDLERRFHVLASEIEKALNWRFLDSGLRIETKGKSIVFYWKLRTSAEIKTLNERANIRALREAAASWPKFRKVKGKQAFLEAGGPDAIHKIEQSLREAAERLIKYEGGNDAPYQSDDPRDAVGLSTVGGRRR